MKKDKRTLALWGGLCALLLSLTAGLSGCLTPGQRAVLIEAEASNQKTLAVLSVLEPEITKVQGWIANKKIGPDEGKALLAALNDKKGELKEALKESIATISKMKAAEMPWYGYVFAGLNALAGIGGTFLGTRKVGAVTGAMGSLSRGLDAGLSALPAESRATVLSAMDTAALADGTRAKLKSLHHKAIAGKI